MEIFSALLAICAGNSSATGEFPSRRPGTQSYDFFLICTLINGCVNNRETGDLRRHRAHYDDIVMYVKLWDTQINLMTWFFSAYTDNTQIG